MVIGKFPFLAKLLAYLYGPAKSISSILLSVGEYIWLGFM
jgi:hypothetical protein